MKDVYLVAMLVRRTPSLLPTLFSLFKEVSLFSHILFMFFLYLPSYTCLASNASSLNLSSLIGLPCSYACKEFNNYAKVILDRSLVLSNVVIIASNLPSIVTNFFPTM